MDRSPMPWRSPATPNFAAIAKKLIAFAAARENRHLSLTGRTRMSVGATAEPFLQNGHNTERGLVQENNKVWIARIIKVEGLRHERRPHVFENCNMILHIYLICLNLHLLSLL